MTHASKPDIFNGDLAHLPEALNWLTAQKRWVVWKWVKRVTKSGEERWTKPPYQPAFPNVTAKSDDPSTWGSYEDAVAAVAAGHANGIGVMLLEGELAAADLDKCRDPATGGLSLWAQQCCAEAHTRGLYVEVTVSGTGLRFIGRSYGDKLHCRFPFDRASGEGLELYRRCERYITISGLQSGFCKTMGEIDDYLDLLFQRFNNPQSQSQPAISSTLDLNTAGPQQSDYFRDILENGVPEGERSERFAEVVWHLASTGMTIDEIVEELAKHPNGIGAKYAKRLFAEVTRCFNKWKKRRMASVGIIGAALSRSGIGAAGAASAAAGAMNWPQIKVIPGELPRVVNEAENALLQSGIEFYQRGGMLMRPVRGTIVNHDGETEGWQLIQVNRPFMVDTLCCAAQFVRWNKSGATPGWKPIDAPDKVANALLSRRGKWNLPFLNGLVQAPFLRIDGSLCETPGYDLESKLLFRADDVFPPIPQQPSRDDALKALKLLETLISTFPFVSSADRSVALAAMLTSLDRRSMSTAPLFAFDSPAAGTGKSKLVDVCSIMATGEKIAVISQGDNDEELVKGLSSSLLAGMLAVSIDNCERTVKGDFLCQMLTQPKLSIRILGLSVVVETPANAIVFATGNNLSFSGDLTRRTLMCSMDAGCERPELRSFQTDVIEETRDRRGELVAAGLTVLRAWRVADERLNLPAFGGFEDWSYRVREALVWLDRTDPCETLAEVRKSDPERSELITVIEQWKQHLVLDQAYTVQQVIARAIIDPDFFNALVGVAGNSSGSAVNNMRLGRWLKRSKSKVVNGLKLLQAGSTGGYPKWRLTRN